MSSALHSERICCSCGTEYEYLIEWPPIPAIVVRFIGDDGAPDEFCRNCGEELAEPDGAPRVGTYAREQTKTVTDWLGGRSRTTSVSPERQPGVAVFIEADRVPSAEPEFVPAGTTAERGSILSPGIPPLESGSAS